MRKLFKQKQNFIIGLLLVSIASLILFGIVGVGRSDGYYQDFHIMYTAGRAWIEGMNPYDQSQLRQIDIAVEDAPFSYPPQSAALFVPLALLNYPTAKIVFLILNLLSVIAIVAITINIINRQISDDIGKIGGGIISAFILGSPLTTNVIWEGQVVMICLAATIAAWFFKQKSSWLLSGICLSIASIKPNIAILVILWFLLERNWKILLTALLSTGILSIYPIINYGIIGAFTAWYIRLQSHQAYSANAPGSEVVIGLQSLFYAAGVHLPSLGILGMILVVILYFFRNRIFQNKISKEWDILAILMALTLLFIFNMDSAYVAIIPIITALWIHSYSRWKVLIGNVFLLGLFMLPRRIVRTFEIPVLNHWRTVIVLLFLIILIFLVLSEKTSPQPEKLSS